MGVTLSTGALLMLPGTQLCQSAKARLLLIVSVT